MLLKKFFNVGFDGIDACERTPYGLDDLMRYPLFAPGFLDFMRRVMPPQRHAELVAALVVTAHKPQAAAGSLGSS